MDAKLTTQCPVSMSHHHGHGHDVIYLHSPVTQENEAKIDNGQLISTTKQILCLKLQVNYKYIIWSISR